MSKTFTFQSVFFSYHPNYLPHLQSPQPQPKNRIQFGSQSAQHSHQHVQQQQPLYGIRSNNPNDNRNKGDDGSESTWQCPTCTFYNSNVAVSCKICQNPKPRKVQSQPKQQHVHPPQPPSVLQSVQNPVQVKCICTGINDCINVLLYD